MDPLGKIAHRAFTNIGPGRTSWDLLRCSTQRLWNSAAAAALVKDAVLSSGEAFFAGMMEDTGLPVKSLPQWSDCCESLKNQYEQAAAACLRAASRSTR